jgi:hypothetical protein
MLHCSMNSHMQRASFLEERAMTTTAASAHPPATARRPEPWGIWAAILCVIVALGVAVATLGVAGLVAVMVPAALGMLVLLSFIVFG